MKVGDVVIHKASLLRLVVKTVRDDGFVGVYYNPVSGRYGAELFVFSEVTEEGT